MSKALKTAENRQNPRIVSLQQAALLLDRDRNTITKWISQGLPTVGAADKSQGKSWELDLAQVVRWMEERAAAVAAAGVTIDPTGMPKEEADRRRAVALAGLAELELEEARRSVAKIDDIADLVAGEYAAVRASLQAIPAKLATRLIGQTDPNTIQIEVEDSIRYALESLRYVQPAS
jgi:phage terminase Nu1 subunit (DNA packaging protein)